MRNLLLFPALTTLSLTLFTATATADGAAPDRAAGRRCGTPLLQDHYRLAAAHHPGVTGDDLEGQVARAYRPKNRVGDTRVFWSYDLSVMPPRWIQVPSTCRTVGEHCYIFVADDQWNLHMDQEDVEEARYRFDVSTPGSPEVGIYEMDTSLFGTPPDALDEDPRIYIFYSALGGFGGSIFDGYFDPMNELTEEEARRQGGHSNEVEMFYMSCDPVNPVAPSTLSVLAHEFEHMIHWNYDPNENSWVDEGCAEIAMLFYGVPDPITGFPGDPDDSLVEWDQHWADYVKSYLFTLYFHEHFGGDDAVRALVAEPTNSIQGYENTLATMGYAEIGFSELFSRWTAANLLDDPSLEDGRYGYELEDLPTFASKWHGGYPVLERTGSTENWACDYLRFDDPEEVARGFYFDGDDDAEFRAFLVLTGEGITTRVSEISLAEDLFGTALVAAESGCETPYLIVDNCTNSFTKSYRYGTDLAIPAAATADDGELAEVGVDGDDAVTLLFTYPSSRPEVNAASIDSLLALSGGHSWLDGGGGIGGAEWNEDGDELRVALSVAAGAPSIAVGDTITVWVDGSGAQVALGGDFSPVGIEGDPGAGDGALPAAETGATLRVAPNPFNPRTVIRFSVEQAGHASVRAYDLSGKVVATLLEGKLEAGAHALTWDGAGLASGVYVVRLESAAGARSTRRVLLLK
jgi:hypothetical protein